MSLEFPFEVGFEGARADPSGIEALSLPQMLCRVLSGSESEEARGVGARRSSALPLRSMPRHFHSEIGIESAQPHPHRRQTLQMPAVPESFLSEIELGGARENSPRPKTLPMPSLLGRLFSQAMLEISRKGAARDRTPRQ